MIYNQYRTRCAKEYSCNPTEILVNLCISAIYRYFSRVFPRLAAQPAAVPERQSVLLNLARTTPARSRATPNREMGPSRGRVAESQGPTGRPQGCRMPCLWYSSSRRIALRLVHNRLRPDSGMSGLVNLLAQLRLQLIDGLHVGRAQGPAIGLRVGRGLLFDRAELGT